MQIIFSIFVGLSFSGFLWGADQQAPKQWTFVDDKTGTTDRQGIRTGKINVKSGVYSEDPDPKHQEQIICYPLKKSVSDPGARNSARERAIDRIFLKEDLGEKGKNSQPIPGPPRSFDMRIESLLNQD